MALECASLSGRSHAVSNGRGPVLATRHRLSAPRSGSRRALIQWSVNRRCWPVSTFGMWQSMQPAWGETVQTTAVEDEWHFKQAFSYPPRSGEARSWGL